LVGSCGRNEGSAIDGLRPNTTESVDRTQEVVARGMNDSQFAANPLVTLQHAYSLPPAGKWR
jgi:hypothetical protein